MARRPLAFHLEAERADHGARVRVALARCGEVALHEDGVGGEEGQALRRTERALAPARGPDLGARVGQPEERQRAQTTGRPRRGPPEKRRLVFRLWLTKSTPASPSVRGCPSSMMPSETHSSSAGSSARMARAARAKCAMSDALGPRALVTMQKRPAPVAAARRAPA